MVDVQAVEVAGQAGEVDDVALGDGAAGGLEAVADLQGGKRGLAGGACALHG
ncbi:hypothetical protein HMPREF0519_0259 [Lentilactobacillus hilgardii DSM 20176 = ATCC 8290]|uniref:Uncharacterized protein n=1 Tax=Lentilactobacillus hilgardii (strain ATCC 8290 / DSM 20176 / CCUG 30140 / JCM 1155 / KCTC 3500 / NBRC 15886 / NCIMB 8040 / NRRL B-1843 / 9) TaxID=1423757 RepID=C0XG98_LENH9|nr:hypothetical protein HMPREF0519_0259 [Lentilactobacillus hilgardii DSM 20176 = ATCC 8290]